MPVGQPKHGDRPRENTSPQILSFAQSNILNITIDTYIQYYMCTDPCASNF